MKGATKLEVRRWKVTVQVDGARNGEILVSGTRLWQESQDLKERVKDTWWRRQTSAELGREQIVDEMAREEREAADARWPEDHDGAGSEEEESEGDGVGVQVEFQMVERDVQYEKG